MTKHISFFTLLTLRRVPYRLLLLAGLILICPKDDEVDDVLPGEFGKLDAALVDVQLVNAALLQVYEKNEHNMTLMNQDIRIQA